MFYAGAGVISPDTGIDVPRSTGRLLVSMRPPSIGRNTIVATGACQAKIMRKEGLDT